LRWFLNSLEEQALQGDRCEVVVGVAADEEEEVATVLRTHPLAVAGRLRTAEATEGATRGALLNAAWQSSEAPTVVFAAARCWAPQGWLGRCMSAAERDPDAVLQGTVMPDPLEWRAKLAPRYEAARIDPPDPLAGALNSIWPHQALRRLGGFDEGSPLPEAELLCRAARSGLGPAPAPEVLLYSSARELGVVAAARGAWRLRHRPGLAQGLGRRADGGSLAVRHLYLLGASACLAAGRRRGAVPLLFGWLALSGGQPPLRGQWKRAAIRVPGRLLVDSIETAALAWGRIKRGRW
jgi:hypothetical protein